MNVQSTPTDRTGRSATARMSFAGLDLANRLALAPMTRTSATVDGVPTAAMEDYYAEFAEGGFGLLITEGAYTDTLFSQGYRFQPGIVTDEHVRGWRRIVERVNAAGAPVVLQLMHAGALSQGNHYRAGAAGPSTVRPRGEMLSLYGGSGRWPVPRAMAAADIEAAVEGFVASARNARDAGFQGVEIHGANGYLLDQFLTPYTNERTDEFGGTVANRIRLTALVAARVRAELGPDFVVGVRLSQTKVNDSTHRWEGAIEAEAIFSAVAETGVSYIHVAGEGGTWIENATLDGGETITALARRVTGLPVIANGGMHDPDQAEQLIEGGHADLLSVGRGALANPDLPQRLQKGEPLAAFDPAILQPVATLDNAREWWQRRSAV